MSSNTPVRRNGEALSRRSLPLNRRQVCGLFAAPLVSSTAMAAVGSSKRIVIGRTASMTGAPAASVAEQTLGAMLVLDEINAAGGINGRTVDLVQLDDAFTPALAAANAETLIRKEGAVALFFTRGTPMTEAILPALARYRVPLIAPSTGAMAFHDPVNPFVFNLRPTYRAEAKRTVELLTQIGASRIGVIYIKDSFGEDTLVGLQEGFKAVGHEPVFTEGFDRKTLDVSKAVARAEAEQPHAVIIVCPVEPAVKAILALREAGSKARLSTMSTTASQSFVKKLGKHARGVMVTQVFPKETAEGLPLVRDALRALAVRGKGEQLTPAVLEGAASARLLVQALKRAAEPTSQALMAALESGHRFDIGWPPYDISYSPNNHTGIGRYSDISIIAADGSFKR